MNIKTIPTKIRDSDSYTDVLFIILAGVTGVAGSYAVSGYTRQFIVAPIDALVVRLTPGPIIAFFIQNVGEQGHLLHIALSFTIAIGVLAGTAIVGLLVARRFGQPAAGVLLAATLAWGVATAITTEPTLALGAAGPVAVFTAVGTAPFSSPEHDQSRRSVLISAAGAFRFIGISIGLGRLVTTGGPASGEREAVDEEVLSLMQEAESKFLDIEGDIPGLVSTFDEFYNVDIAEFDPDLSAEGWSLTVTGEVETDVTVAFDELTDMPTERRFVTLRCVGESLSGHWTTPFGPGRGLSHYWRKPTRKGSVGVRCSARRTITSSSSRSKRSKTGFSRGG
jgi:Oxidoreductase molybdopterin binding domain.